jgi:hypothetical protein
MEWIWNSYYIENNFGHAIVLRFLLKKKNILDFKNMNSEFNHAMFAGCLH